MIVFIGQLELHGHYIQKYMKIVNWIFSLSVFLLFVSFHFSNFSDFHHPENISIKMFKEDEQQTDDAIRSEDFRGKNILAHDVVAVASTPIYVNHKKCYAIGLSILELSKLQMYKAWFDKK